MSEERRRAERYPVEIQIEFDGGAGLTRDVSGLGVYFETQARLDPGDELDFTMVIPDAVYVGCRGTVRRVDRRDDALGVAVSIEEYRLAEDGTVEIGGDPHLVIQELRRYHD